MKNPNYSIILPIRNEEESLPQLFDEIKETFKYKNYEIIAVDDASGFRDHLGKWEALRAGISRAKGSVIITIDADLQDDPRELPKLLKKLDEGYDIVSGWRKPRHDPYYKILLTRLANIIYGYHDFSSPMKVYRKEVMAELPKEGSLLRYSYLLGNQLGFRVAEVPVVHRPRTYGKSKFGIVKYFRILYDLLLIRLLFWGSNRV